MLELVCNEVHFLRLILMEFQHSFIDIKYVNRDKTSSTQF